MRATWIDGRGWVRFVECRECGCDVELGECCDCREVSYIECALWSSTADPFGTCPMCDRENVVLDRWDAEQVHVCSKCSERTPNYEPPADENYGVSDLAPEALARMVADCEKFQADNAEWITDAHLTNANSEALWDADEKAGHDFWLTRNGHGAGFWDGDWLDDAGKALTAASKAFGECSLYVGDDGRLYIS